jgi:hypothetical protein
MRPIDLRDHRLQRILGGISKQVMGFERAFAKMFENHP